MQQKQVLGGQVTASAQGIAFLTAGQDVTLTAVYAAAGTRSTSANLLAAKRKAPTLKHGFVLELCKCLHHWWAHVSF